MILYATFTNMEKNKESDQKPRPLSGLLYELSEGAKTCGDKVPLSFILKAFHERGFGVILFFLALPAALPIPALGINVIIALPILLLTLQQAIGRHTIWLPQKVKKRSFKTTHLLSFINKSMPIVRFTEFISRPRLAFLTRGIFSLLIGITGSLFAISITFPIPLTNTVPAMAICLMAIGVIMRDGIAVLAGMVLGLIWIFLLSYVTLVYGIDGIILIKEMIKSALGLTP